MKKSFLFYSAILILSITGCKTNEIQVLDDTKKSSSSTAITNFLNEDELKKSEVTKNYDIESSEKEEYKSTSESANSITEETEKNEQVKRDLTSVSNMNSYLQEYFPMQGFVYKSDILENSESDKFEYLIYIEANNSELDLQMQEDFAKESPAQIEITKDLFKMAGSISDQAELTDSRVHIDSVFWRSIDKNASISSVLLIQDFR